MTLCLADISRNHEDSKTIKVRSIKYVTTHTEKKLVPKSESRRKKLAIPKLTCLAISQKCFEFIFTMKCKFFRNMCHKVLIKHHLLREQFIKSYNGINATVFYGLKHILDGVKGVYVCHLAICVSCG